MSVKSWVVSPFTVTGTGGTVWNLEAKCGGHFTACLEWRTARSSLDHLVLLHLFTHTSAPVCFGVGTLRICASGPQAEGQLHAGKRVAPCLLVLFMICFYADLGLLVATSTANTTAVLRTLPAIAISASETGACCSANPSRRVLTL